MHFVNIVHAATSKYCDSLYSEQTSIVLTPRPDTEYKRIHGQCVMHAPNKSDTLAEHASAKQRTEFHHSQHNRCKNLSNSDPATREY